MCFTRISRSLTLLDSPEVGDCAGEKFSSKAWENILSDFYGTTDFPIVNTPPVRLQLTMYPSR